LGIPKPRGSVSSRPVRPRGYDFLSARLGAWASQNARAGATQLLSARHAAALLGWSCRPPGRRSCLQRRCCGRGRSWSAVARRRMRRTRQRRVASQRWRHPREAARRRARMPPAARRRGRWRTYCGILSRWCAALLEQPLGHLCCAALTPHVRARTPPRRRCLQAMSARSLARHCCRRCCRLHRLHRARAARACRQAAKSSAAPCRCKR
jgi:hypothetical protein